jgi:hypothetical protein
MNLQIQYHVHNSPPVDPTLSCWILSTNSHLISSRYILILSSHFHLGHSGDFFPSDFLTQIISAFLISTIYPTCPTNLRSDIQKCINYLTPYKSVCKKLTVTQLAKKFPAFYLPDYMVLHPRTQPAIFKIPFATRVAFKHKVWNYSTSFITDIHKTAEAYLIRPSATAVSPEAHHPQWETINNI